MRIAFWLNWLKSTGPQNGLKLHKEFLEDKESNAGRDGLIIWILRFPKLTGVTMRSGYSFCFINFMEINGLFWLNWSQGELIMLSRTIGTQSWRENWTFLKKGSVCWKLSQMSVWRDFYWKRLRLVSLTITPVRRVGRRITMSSLRRIFFRLMLSLQRENRCLPERTIRKLW